MDEKVYISIKEFAEKAGVSRQAIQQRLSASLAEFVKVDAQGKKTISTNALQLFDKQGSKAKEQGSEEKSKAKEQGSNDALLYSALLQTVETLKEQLAAKDRQIEALCSALENAQRAATQAQALHAGTMQRELLEAPQKDKEPEPKRGFFSLWRRGNGK